jgi:hypothetical protein
MKQRPKNVQRINETKNWSFEKINEIDNLLANLTKMKNKRPKLVKSDIKKER